jgi:GNAT superfamily N-acetyltransferase
VIAIGISNGIEPLLETEEEHAACRRKVEESRGVAPGHLLRLAQVALFGLESSPARSHVNFAARCRVERDSSSSSGDTARVSERHFTLDYVERAVLRNGTAVRLRLLAPEDKALLRAGFEKLSAESRYARFLAPKTTLTDEELRYLTEIDQENHFALGAVREEGDGSGAPVGLGIARFIRLDDPTSAEAAIAVADEIQGCGLGRLLFVRLCAAAAERGIERFHCDVLGSNTDMALLAKVCPERTVEVEAGVMRIELPLPNVAPREPAEGPPPAGPMYRLFRAAAENAVEWTAAVRKLWRRE